MVFKPTYRAEKHSRFLIPPTSDTKGENHDLDLSISIDTSTLYDDDISEIDEERTSEDTHDYRSYDYDENLSRDDSYESFGDYSSTSLVSADQNLTSKRSVDVEKRQTYSSSDVNSSIFDGEEDDGEEAFLREPPKHDVNSNYQVGDNENSFHFYPASSYTYPKKNEKTNQLTSTGLMKKGLKTKRTSSSTHSEENPKRFIFSKGIWRNRTIVHDDSDLKGGRIEELCRVQVKKKSKKHASEKSAATQIEEKHNTDRNIESRIDSGKSTAMSSQVGETNVCSKIHISRPTKKRENSDKSVATSTIRVKKEKSTRDIPKYVGEDPVSSKATTSSARHLFKNVGIGKTVKQKQKFTRVSMEDNLEATYNEFGEPKVLQIKKYSPSTLRDGVIVQIEASTVCFNDCLMRRNLATNFGPVEVPMSPGVDCIGTIVYCGDLAEMRNGLRVGDRVCALHPFLGGNSRFVTIPSKYIHAVPRTVDACQAACIVQSYLAAVQMLYRAGGMKNKTLQKGQKVLVTGANGNLGRAVVELAKIAGAKVYASCRKQHKMFVVGELGADVWMSEDPSQWNEKLSVDIVVDCVCYTGYKRYLLKKLGSNGVKVVSAGEARKERDQIKRQKKQFSAMMKDDDVAQRFCGIEFVSPVITDEDIYQPERPSIYHRMSKALTEIVTHPFSSKLVRYNVFDSSESRPDLMTDDLSLLFDLLECNVINPKVAMTVGLDQIPKAHIMLEKGGLQGAIVCRPN